MNDHWRTRLAAGLTTLRARRDSLLLATAALLLATTFLDPGWPVQRARVEVVAVVDITQSMNVTDQTLNGRPASRLAYAKARLAGLIEQLPCDSRVGLGIFTEYRSFLLLTPLEVCRHQKELLGTLAMMDGRMAWAGASEVAKALNSGMVTVKALDGSPALMLLTDGHESPPVNPRYRPNFNVARGEVRGLIVGVGGDEPLPIPKFDPSGVPHGEWAADEVFQVDPRSLGRGGSVGGEQMVEPEGEAAVEPLPGATPGHEHLSSLREDYLRLLASETGLGYLRLSDTAPLAATLGSSRLAREAPGRLDLRPWLGGAALLCVLLPLIPPWLSRWRRGAAHQTAGRASLPRAMRPQR